MSPCERVTVDPSILVTVSPTLALATAACEFSTCLPPLILKRMSPVSSVYFEKMWTI